MRKEKLRYFFLPYLLKRLLVLDLLFLTSTICFNLRDVTSNDSNKIYFSYLEKKFLHFKIWHSSGFKNSWTKKKNNLYINYTKYMKIECCRWMIDGWMNHVWKSCFSSKQYPYVHIYKYSKVKTTPTFHIFLSYELHRLFCRINSI